MEFEYIGHWYISEEDLNEMAILVKEGHNVKDAIYDVASGWDDYDYYSIENIFEQLRDEVLRRAEKV